MHSFHPSRGRVFFEVLCAVGMAASLAGAWMQTHAAALLGAAGIAGLYALVRLFDMRQPKAAVAAEPQRVEFAPESVDIVVPMVAGPVVEAVAEDMVEPTEARTSEGRRSGGSRKGTGRRTKGPKAAKVVDLAPVEEPDAPWPVTDEPEVQELAELADEEFVFSDDGEPSQSHIAPLFEPEPFARMQRRAFGRRGRL
jgi:hypothetical protein